MAKILVTGGAGYIGSICSAQLMQQGHSVLIVDDFSTGHREALPPRALVRHADIRDQPAIRAILSEYKVDVVFHFAAKALIPESMSNPGVFFDSNVASGIVFLEELRRAGVHKFIFSSSAAVYGNPKQVPIVENHPTDPVNSYGETKLMFERTLAWYARAYGWGIVAMRYFNACGGWQQMGERHYPETHIIPLLLEAATGDHSIFKVYGADYPTEDGTCLRDYVHVLDIADAHIRAIPLLDSPGMNIFNIGTGTSYSVKQIIRVTEEVIGHRVPVQIAARRSGDPAILCASPARLMGAVNWQPGHSDLRNIVQTAWDFHQSIGNQIGMSLTRS